MRRKLFVLAAASVLGIATTAAAETWQCDYSGRWSTQGSSNDGKFKWMLTWRGSSGNGWTVIGDYSDQYGGSHLDGTCKSKRCTLTQTYTSGKLTGEKYVWSGSYTDQRTGPSETINTFTGTWQKTGAANKGPWSATAVCKKSS